MKTYAETLVRKIYDELVASGEISLSIKELAYTKQFELLYKDVRSYSTLFISKGDCMKYLIEYAWEDALAGI
jgi:hypothetical protein